MSTTQIPKIPFGWHFNPDDNDIVALLASRLEGHPHHRVAEVDVFAETPPWEIFKDDDDDVRYFFTRLTKMSENASKNFKRTVGDIGTWKTESSASKIYYPDSRLVIGNRRYFSFKLSRKRKKTSTTSDDSDDASKKYTWGMSEFTLETPENSDFAICRITRKPNGQSRTREDQP